MDGEKKGWVKRIIPCNPDRDRYVVIEDQKFTIFLDSEKRRCEYSADVISAQGEEEMGKEGKRFIFLVVLSNLLSGQFTNRFAAKSEKERDDWLFSIGQHCQVSEKPAKRR